MSVHEQVREYLQQVRRRIQWQKVAHGLGVCGIVALASTVIVVLLANAWNFSEPAVGLFSVVLWLTLAIAAYLFLVRPQLRRISDHRLARFVEESNPQFQDRLVTAVDLSEHPADDASQRFLQELVGHEALERTPEAPPSRLVDPKKIWRPLLWAGGSLAMILLLGLFGPGIFRYGTKVLWIGWAQAKVNPLYSIQVTPGDIVIGRDSDQEIIASPGGFVPENMRLHVQYENNGTWETAPMLPAESGASFHFLLLNVQKPVSYYVDSDGIRSPEYDISVIAVPRVERLEVHYDYPAYSGLPDQVDESGGDIIALKGTQIRLTVHTDAPAQAGRLMLDDSTSMDLERVDENRWQAQWTLENDALYHVRLEDAQNQEARASEEYIMQAVTDQPPSLRLTRPGRDLQPTPIEEVTIAFEGQDDIRLANLDIHYIVNGADKHVVPLVRNGRRQQASASHLIQLEDYQFIPGDLVSYYGTARDAAGNDVTTEMFFLQLRPFERNYMQSQSGGGGGGGQDQEDTFLSGKQKEIISATWNVIRQKERQRPDQLKEAGEVLSTIQRSLQDQARTLVTRIGRRELSGVNDEFSGLAENMNKAIEAMEPAAEHLENRKFDDALTPEQTALQYLMRAEALFRDIQVAYGNQGGGGGGGANSGRDLADLFALELDTSKNQYETLNQFSGGSGSNAEVDEAMRKLQELARRQEELARQQPENPKDSMRAASRWEQEMLRRETEELARKLEQLSRQNNSSQLSQASRSLSQAARDMQQASSSSSSSPGQSGSSGQNGEQNGEMERKRALERLREANQTLSGQQNQWDEQRLREMIQSAGQMAERQERIAEETRQMAARGENAEISESEMREVLSGTFTDKRALLDEIREMERSINEAAGRMAGTQREAAKDLRGASAMIQEERFNDKIRQGAWLSQRGMWPTAAPIEDDLGASMQQLRDRLQQARAAVGAEAPEDKMLQALEAAERVRQGLERMGEGNHEAGQEGSRGSRPGEGQQQASGQSESGQQPGQGQGQNGQPGQQPGQGQQPGSSQSASSTSGNQPGSGGSPGGSMGQMGRRQMDDQHGTERGDGLAAGAFSGRYRGEAYNRGDYTAMPPRPLTPEQQRELERRYQQVQQDATQLRELLASNKEFDRMVQDLARSMRNLDAENFPGDPEEFERLRAELTERWKELELRLRRELQLEDAEALRIAGQERVPEKFRSLVEEYYRSLSRTER